MRSLRHTYILPYSGYTGNICTTSEGFEPFFGVETGPGDLLGLGEGVQHLLLVHGPVVVPVRDGVGARVVLLEDLLHQVLELDQLGDIPTNDLVLLVVVATAVQDRADRADLPAVRTALAAAPPAVLLEVLPRVGEPVGHSRHHAHQSSLSIILMAWSKVSTTSVWVRPGKSSQFGLPCQVIPVTSTAAAISVALAMPSDASMHTLNSPLLRLSFLMP